jgi:ribonucleoside-triphosphate reductase
VPEAIVKRDGRVVPFDPARIESAVLRAFQATGEAGDEAPRRAREVTAEVVARLGEVRVPHIEQVQDLVEEALMRAGWCRTAKAYILYREQRRQVREMRSLVSSDLIDSYLAEADWRVRENANVGFSLQGLNVYLTGAMAAEYWLQRVYPPEVREAHRNGDLHLHDLAFLANYCCGWDLQALLREGFGGVPGHAEASPPKHFRSALGQVYNFLYTLQGEAAGAQAFSSFDTLLAPYVRADGLTYEEVRQALQEAIFNLNTPTRVGAQCLSEDTEILTAEGWKTYRDVRPGTIIATFNLERAVIEYLPAQSVYVGSYRGSMWRLRNRITDQVISPGHRVVRKLFHTERYVLQPVEEVVKLKSPFIVPVGSGGQDDPPQACVSVDEARLLAWIIADGWYEPNSAGSGRIGIVQSPGEHPDQMAEVVALCERLGLEYSTRKTNSPLSGKECVVLRLNAEATRRFLRILGYENGKPLGSEDIKFVPEAIKNGGRTVCSAFLDAYLKADGNGADRIRTSSERLRDDLMQVAVNAGYGITCRQCNYHVKPGMLNKKPLYVLRLIKHADTYVTDVEKVAYEGIIWCPHTVNETVVARRNGKVFITGNTPFTNVTLDLFTSAYDREPALVDGREMPWTYGELQEERLMIARAFCEVMLRGDASGRGFTFPVPTFNVTRDWAVRDVPEAFRLAAKYGSPYFANFISSDLSPDDVRSLCCRLRLDKRELLRRGGGLFGANPMTGSVGVVTLNLPRLAYLSRDEEDFFRRLAQLAGVAVTALEVKRKALDRFAEAGLYPFTARWLKPVKERFGSYFANHFSTIGVVGGNEMCLNLLGVPITDPAGRAFAVKVLQFLREFCASAQERTGHLYNLEATPAEGCSHRLARIDKAKYPDIVVANEAEWKKGAAPYYTNSTHPPVGWTDDPLEVLEHQEELQALYTGGTVVHFWLGEALPDPEACREFVLRVCEGSRVPYITLTPTYSVCPEHGYLPGEQPSCPHCGAATEVWSRVTGYYRPVSAYNAGKQAEFRDRASFRIGRAD